jgi:parallel beta-helix repeat protein
MDRLNKLELVLYCSFSLFFAGCGATAPPAPVQPSLPQIINVRDAPYNATGNGSTDDTAAIQRAVTAAGGTGKTVFVPDGNYRINAIAVTTGGNHGIALSSNMTLQLSSNAVLQALPNAADTSAILWLDGVRNVTITGGTVEGERATHTGTTGQWGMGISIYDSSSITVDSVTTEDCWGDGLYVGGTVGAQNLAITNVTSIGNRRQGMSITAANGVVVKNSTFKNNSGTSPQSGIDIEPNPGNAVNNVLISGNTFSNNGGSGVQSGVPMANSVTASVTAIVIDSNTFTGNGTDPVDGVDGAIDISNSSGTQVTNNIVTGNASYGILIHQAANNSVVTGNTISGTTGMPGNGIDLDSSSGATVTGNTSTGNFGYGIYQDACASCTITGNTLSGNGQTQ